MKRLEINYTLNGIDALVSLSRYNFVNRTNPNKNLKVLDFGCGSGYGTKVLKEHFNDVDAYDSYPDNYFPKNFNLITDLDELKNDYDIITNFEVIEHLERSEHKDFLKLISSKIKKGGLLYISTVRKMTPPPTKNREIEHKCELSFEELFEVCSENFSKVLTFGQIDQNISTFYKENTYHNLFICVK